MPNAKFRESIDMGEFKGSFRDVSAAISDLRRDFRGEVCRMLILCVYVYYVCKMSVRFDKQTALTYINTF